MFKAVLAIALATSTLVQANTRSFDEGIVVAPLTQSERDDLRQYAESSKSTLQETLEEAKGKTFREANDIYLRAITQVVENSFIEKRRSELLMRMVLNQALELTVGIPNATPGVLIDATNRNLSSIILEDSINLALKYIVADTKALDDGTLEKLPYLIFSVERLIAARQWGAAITEAPLQYAYFTTILKQWMAVATHEGQPHRGAIAKELLRIDSLLRKPRPLSESELKGRIRILRGEVRKLIDGLSGVVSLKIGDEENGALKIEATTNESSYSNPRSFDVADADEIPLFKLDTIIGVTEPSNSKLANRAMTFAGRAEKTLVLTPRTNGFYFDVKLNASARYDRAIVGASRKSHLSAGLSLGASNLGAYNLRLGGGNLRYSYDNDYWTSLHQFSMSIAHLKISTDAALGRRSGLVADLEADLARIGVPAAGHYISESGNKHEITQSLSAMNLKGTLGYCSKNFRCITDTLTTDWTFYYIDSALQVPDLNGNPTDAEGMRMGFSNDVNAQLSRQLSLGYNTEYEYTEDTTNGIRDKVQRDLWRHMFYLKGRL